MNASRPARRKVQEWLEQVVWTAVAPRVIAVALLQAACVSEDRASLAVTEARSGAVKAEDFLVVDCLLPARIHQLGQRLTYLAPRQAIKTSGGDCEIRGGEYVKYDRANYATALQVWLPLAEGGDAQAQTYVGEIFEKGRGVPPDYGAAATWYQRAAEQGYSRAAINLGNLYEQGLGVPPDPRQALNWYRKAAGLSALTFEIVPGRTEAELKESRTQISTLRAQLTAKQEEFDKLQGELEAMRRSLEKGRQETDQLRSRLEELRSQLKASPPSQGSPEKSELQQTIRNSELRQSIKETEDLLAAKQQEMNALRLAIDRGTRGTQQFANLRHDLAQAEAEFMMLKAGFRPLKEETAQGGPRIEVKQVQVLEPEFIASTRDIKATPVALAAGARSWIVVGRVETDTGLKSITINDRPQPPNRDGAFKVHLSESDRQLRVVATDRRDRTSTLELALPAPTASAPSRGERDVARLTPSQISQLNRSLGNYHALVIGNNNYRQLAGLRTAVNDAEAVAKVLREQYRFRVTLLTNSTRYEVLNALNELRGRLTKDDNLLIYYAGHGHLDEASGRGYWLPVDAEPNSNTNWIANEDVTSILDAMAVRQLLLVADSCYSGTLTRSVIGQLDPGRTPDELVRLIGQMAQKRSRIAMTSGGLAPILDSAGGAHSVFTEVFLKVLSDNDGVLLGRDVFRRVQLQVAEVAGRLPVPQEPQYAPIKPGHEGGDFVLLRPVS